MRLAGKAAEIVMIRENCQAFRIGSAEFDPVSNEVRIDGVTKRIEPRLMSLLQCLIDQAGQVVGRDALLDSAWPTGTANDESLTQAISTLRALLRDSPKSPRLIETIPKTGYRFIGQIRPINPRHPPDVNAESRSKVHILPIWIFAGGILLVAVVVLLLMVGEPDPDPDYEIEIEDMNVELAGDDPDP